MSCPKPHSAPLSGHYAEKNEDVYSGLQLNPTKSTVTSFIPQTLLNILHNRSNINVVTHEVVCSGQKITTF